MLKLAPVNYLVRSKDKECLQENVVVWSFLLFSNGNAVKDGCMPYANVSIRVEGCLALEKLQQNHTDLYKNEISFLLPSVLSLSFVYFIYSYSSIILKRADFV